jgi:5'-methylthioinosine phosphorylase|tara:strand:- start:334 stop:528 length:195 start_codon:yes stop_codon:yes gene_type:complete
MTAMPEAALARELALPYAGISVTVNPGAGMAERDIALSEIHEAMNQGLSWVKMVLAELLSTPAV